MNLLISSRRKSTTKGRTSKIKAFNQTFLKAAQMSISRGDRKNYKPHWTEELHQKDDAVREARNLFEEYSSEENNISLKAASTKPRRILIQEPRKTWYEKTEQFNPDLDGKKPWNLVETLNDGRPKSSQIIMEQEEKTLHWHAGSQHPGQRICRDY